jgi:hypothetical protein
MGPIGCPETSTTNCKPRPRNIPEEQRPNYNAAEAGYLVSGKPGNILSKGMLQGEPDGTQIKVDGWRMREHDRPWTDIKGYWRQGQVEKLRCG